MRGSKARAAAIAAVLLLAIGPALLFGQTRTPTKLNEAPMLAEQVKAGKLPPVDKRLPEEPLVIKPGGKGGKDGGTRRMTTIGTNDYGTFWNCYIPDGLLAWDVDCTQLEPNIAKSWQVSPDGKVMTFTLRKGMKWSDGQPFTVDDVLFFWDDMSMNKELSPIVPEKLRTGADPGRIQKIDDYTFRITWAKPYGTFLEYLADDYFPAMCAPKHYLAQFHPKYGNKATIEAEMKKGGFNTWQDLFSSKNRADNPDCPSIRAFVPTNGYDQPLQKNVRNPYYWKVDPAGNQLPYIDYETHTLCQPEAALLKAIAGEIDCQQRYFATLANYQTIMENRQKGDYRVIVGAGEGWSYAGIAGGLYFNFHHKDPELRKLFNDRRFRQALSVAIDRNEVNQILFKGLGVVASFSAREDTVWYDEKLSRIDTEYDTAKANRILDDMGIKWDGARKWRLRSDGKPLSWVVNSYLELEPRAHGAAVGELVKGYWAKIGIDVSVKPLASQLAGPRIIALDYDMFAHNAQPGNPGWPPLLRPELFFTYVDYPTAPAWARWFMTSGKEGEEPPADAKQIMALRDQVISEADNNKRVALTKQAFEIWSRNQWILGMVRTPPQDTYLVVKNNFRNVPNKPFMIFPFNFSQCFFD
jgi:peptide/nickel transport system substrate-binding protein